MLFFVTSVGQSFIFQSLTSISNDLSIRMRAALVAAIYRKGLLVTPAAMQRRTVGEVLNLMSVDVQRLQDFVQFGALVFVRCESLAICVRIYSTEY